MQLPSVHAIVLNFNRPVETAACVDSLLACDYPCLRILVLDYGEPFAPLQDRYPQVTVIPLHENLGYAGNNNIGIAAALRDGAEWIFLLNDDTTQTVDCLSALMKVAVSDERIGILGPLVYHADESNVIQTAGGMLGLGWSSLHLGQNETDSGRFSQPCFVQWISGCAILVRSRMIDAIGKMDERFFLYWEETEWCLRAGKAGWKIVMVPAAHLWHRGVRRDYQPSPTVTYYAARNHFLLMALHRAPLLDWLAASFQTLRTLLSWTLRPRWKGKRPHRDALFRGLIDYFRGRFGPISPQ